MSRGLLAVGGVMMVIGAIAVGATGAGANKSPRLMTEVPLMFGKTTVPPGEYSLFIDLKLPEWT